MTGIEEKTPYKGTRFDPQRLARPDLALEYSQAFDEYVNLRVEGVPANLALIESFELIRFGIDLDNINQLTLAIETNPYVKVQFRKVLASKSVKEDLWTPNDSANQLLKMIKDENVRSSTRLSAITALNLLCGYVVLDEGTMRRAQQTLRDFEKMNEAWKAQKLAEVVDEAAEEAAAVTVKH